jgi:GMP synthase (glutamine-hydrolysing)
MRIAILQNNSDDGPAYFGTWLTQHGVDFDVFNFDAGEWPPATLTNYAGLALLGGPMSVNDDLPSLRMSEVLIRDARDAGKPVIGHCLGGQLIASALGATVAVADSPEIGWSKIKLSDSAAARDWFGEFVSTERETLQWHYDAFSLPEGAMSLAGNDVCPVQAFAVHNMLAMQFHIEIDRNKLASWARNGKQELTALIGQPHVQQARTIAAEIPLKMAASHALADRIYEHFVRLARGFSWQDTQRATQKVLTAASANAR